MCGTGNTIDPVLLKDMYDIAEACHKVHKNGRDQQFYLLSTTFCKVSISRTRDNDVTITLYERR